MRDWKLQVYHALPYPLRSMAASLRGYYLRSWRYSPSTEQLVEEALAREGWSQEAWKIWQEERLAYLLKRAATQVPFYQSQWSERRRHGDRASWEVLDNWPILEKESLRQSPRAFLVEGCSPRRMFHEHTSGTTGKSLDLWWSRETVQAWYALSEARLRHWYGVSRHQRWAILGGQLVTPVRQRQPPFWVWNKGLNQLYLSSYHLAPDLIPHYLEALALYQIDYLFGYTSSLYALAQEALRSGWQGIKFTVAITNAEPLYEYQRQEIARAFGCPVRESYGMAEIVAAASECQAGRLHLWPEVGILEIPNPDQSSPQEISGELVCTGLLNAEMPLIRYRLGDRATLPVNPAECPCGRHLPILKSIDGRNDDILYTKDGRKIGRLDPAFKAHLPVREAQIIQEALDRVRVRFVPAPDFTHQAGLSIVERLQSRMGPVEVILEAVKEIPRESNGKFRAVICALPAEETGKYNTSLQ